MGPDIDREVMEEAAFDHAPATSLRATIAGARSFGLTEDEAWVVVDGVLYAMGEESTLSEYLDLLNDALAQAVLAKHRRVVSGEGAPAAEEGRPKKRGILSRNRW